MTRCTDNSIGERAPGISDSDRCNDAATAAPIAVVDDIGTRTPEDAARPDLVAKAHVHSDAGIPFLPPVQATRLIPCDMQDWDG